MEAIKEAVPTVSHVEQNAEAKADSTPNDFYAERHRITDAALTDTLTKAAEKSIARQDREQASTAPAMPSPMAAKGSISDAVERASQWLDTPLDERKSLAAAHQDIEQRRAEAAKLGLTLEERESMLAAEQRKVAAAEQSEFEPVKSTYRELYPEAKAAEVAQRYGEIDKFIRKDPVAGVRWLAEQYGVDVSQLSAPQPQPHQPADVRSVVVAFANQTPDWAQLQTPILKALQSGAVPLTGDTEGDLKKAYEHVKAERTKRPQPKPKGKVSWEATLERVGKEITARA